MAVKDQKRLTAADILAERSRHRITQTELATELGWYVQVIPPVEDGRVELSQDEYQRMLAAVEAIVARRAEGNR